MPETKTKTSVSVRPLGGRVVVHPLKSEGPQEKGGIYIPDTAQDEQSQKGQVVAVGPGKLTEDGQRLPMELDVGDRVLFKRYGPDEVEIGGQTVLLIEQEDVLGIIEG